MNFVEYIYRSEVKVKGLRNADNLFGSAFELFYYLLNKSYENKKKSHPKLHMFCIFDSYVCYVSQYLSYQLNFPLI